MTWFGVAGVALLSVALLLGITNLVLCNFRWWTGYDAAALGGVQIALAALGGPCLGAWLGLYLAGAI